MFWDTSGGRDPVRGPARAGREPGCGPCARAYGRSVEFAAMSHQDDRAAGARGRRRRHATARRTPRTGRLLAGGGVVALGVLVAVVSGAFRSGQTGGTQTGGDGHPGLPALIQADPSGGDPEAGATGTPAPSVSKPSGSASASVSASASAASSAGPSASGTAVAAAGTDGGSDGSDGPADGSTGDKPGKSGSAPGQQKRTP